MSEYAENTENEKSNGKKSDSNKPSNREMDYFGENPAKLDNLLSENGKKDNRGQKNDYFGENPTKLDKILSEKTINNKIERKLDYFEKFPKDLDKILDTTHNKKPMDNKLDEFVSLESFKYLFSNPILTITSNNYITQSLPKLKKMMYWSWAVS
ncbi:hypothetical protein ES708_14597 [subsurface metagenome]